MSTEDNKALLRRYIDSVFNGDNADAVTDLFADSYVGRANGAEIDRDAIPSAAEHWRSTGLETRTTIEDLIALGEKVVARLAIRASRNGGAEERFTRIVIFRVAGGKFVESWAEGVTPPA